MRVVTEDILLFRRQLVGPMKLGREVAGEKLPHIQRSKELRSISQLAVGRSSRHRKMDQVRDQDGPAERVRAGEPECRHEDDDAHAVKQDSCRLQSTDEWHLYWREANASSFVCGLLVLR